MRTIYLAIPTAAFERLRELAQLEFRGAKEQAVVLILEGLERHAADTPGKRHTHVRRRGASDDSRA